MLKKLNNMTCCACTIFALTDYGRITINNLKL